MSDNIRELCHLSHLILANWRLQWFDSRCKPPLVHLGTVFPGDGTGQDGGHDGFHDVDEREPATYF